MNAFSILFSDTFYYDRIGELTKNRNLASVPFGGRYRLVDFVLSSLVKAHVPNVGVITRNNYSSLVDHLGSGKDWDLDRKNGGLKILTPFANNMGNGSSKNKFEALNSIKTYIRHNLPDYAILADTNIICNIDFKAMIQYHKDVNADVVCLYKKRDIYEGSTSIAVSENGQITGSRYHGIANGEQDNFVLKVYVMKKDFLLNLIDTGITYGWEEFNRDFITKHYFNYRIFAMEQKGYCKVLRNINDYYQANMDLLNPEIRREIFQSDTNILTKIKDSVPTMYGSNSKVKNSLIADGCKIDGTVENCVVFRDVQIKKGAVVKNSIIMQGAEIAENCQITNVIADKGMSLNEGVVLTGSESFPFIIAKNTKI
ncbi:MAG: glucose-1-phosphate adenylyltransferase subunit GlgD [Clostridia bacterium]|nr:glucose-1-phosphate adenylyltransferase subunit GlgD [Clostridia bacterium]